MAYEETLKSITLDADSSIGVFTGPPGAPGSASPNYGQQYRFVKVTGSHTAGLSTAGGDVSVGVLQNKPQREGAAATVATHGISMVFVGTGGVTAGDEVEADANGAAVTQSAGTTLGVAIEDGAAGELAPVLLRIN